MQVATIGLDLAKRVFQVCGVDAAGKLGIRAGVVHPTARYGDLGTFAVLVRLGALDQQLQSVVGPDHVPISLRSNSHSGTVTDIARRHGIWVFGRFAGSYSASFGESPSATLLRNQTAQRAATFIQANFWPDSHRPTLASPV